MIYSLPSLKCLVTDLCILIPAITELCTFHPSELLGMFLETVFMLFSIQLEIIKNRALTCAINSCSTKKVDDLTSSFEEDIQDLINFVYFATKKFKELSILMTQIDNEYDTLLVITGSRVGSSIQYIMENAMSSSDDDIISETLRMIDDIKTQEDEKNKLYESLEYSIKPYTEKITALSHIVEKISDDNINLFKHIDPDQQSQMTLTMIQLTNDMICSSKEVNLIVPPYDNKMSIIDMIGKLADSSHHSIIRAKEICYHADSQQEVYQNSQ